MATTSLEQEVKLDADLRFEVPDLSTVAGGATVVRHPVRRLVATYFDTPDLQLVRRGITLRRRQDRVSGGENLWTLKLPEGTQHATMARTEHSWPGEQPEVPEEARFLLRGLIRRTELVMVAKLLTTRRSLGIVGTTGEQLVEVDDDVVSVVRGVRQGLRFREIEVEITGADDDLVQAIVALLGKAGAAPGERRPKLERALGLDLRRTFEVDPTGPDVTLEDLVRQSLAGAMDRLLDHDPGLRVGGGDIEFVHQARVAARRLRSDLKLLSDILDPDWVERARDELRWLGAMLGGVRDADVLTHHLASRTEGSPAVDAPAFAALRTVLATQREHARTVLLRAIESDRYLDLVGDLTAAVALPPVRPTRADLAYDELASAGPPVAEPAPGNARPMDSPPVDATPDGHHQESSAQEGSTGPGSAHQSPAHDGPPREGPGQAGPAGPAGALTVEPTAPVFDPTGGWPETAWGAPGAEPARTGGAVAAAASSSAGSVVVLPVTDRRADDDDHPAGTDVDADTTDTADTADTADTVDTTDDQDDQDDRDDRQTEHQDEPAPQEIDAAAAAADVLPRLLRRQWRKLRRSVREAGKHPTDDQLHAIRIRAKQLRYAAETATPVLGKEVRRLAERAGSLQQVLGDLHDSITTEAWLRQTASSGTTEQAFGAGLLVIGEQQSQERLRRRWMLTWRALALQAKRVVP